MLSKISLCLLLSLGLGLSGCNQFNRQVTPPGAAAEQNWFETLNARRNDTPNPDVPEEWRKVVSSTVYVTPTGSTSFGSGFVIHPDGYVITNRHVVMDEDETELEVSFDQGEVTYKAELVSLNQCDDLALLRIKNTRQHTFPFVTFGPRIKLGEEVWLAGYPGDREQVVLSQGVVAQIARKEIQELLGPADIFAANERLGSGSSGGPMFNAEQEVVGVSYAIDPRGSFEDQYAVRGQTLLEVLPSMLERKFVRGWGFEYDYAARGSIPVNRVYPDSPAAELGLQAGDKITKIEGIFFADKAGQRYCQAMRTDNGDTRSLEVTVERDEQTYVGTIYEEELTKRQTQPTPTSESKSEELPPNPFE